MKPKSAATFGQHIFIYTHLQTKQVVYSLTRSLNNNDALKQLPYLGKKSRPPALRRDLWTPLASVSFPSPQLGLKTYHKLREFRKLHETQYPEEWKHQTSLKERKYKLMDQKAYSIADLAESLRIEIERAAKADQPVDKGSVVVRWSDIFDAEYAARWPSEVLHSLQGRAVNYTAPPIPTGGEIVSTETRTAEAVA